MAKSNPSQRIIRVAVPADLAARFDQLREFVGKRDRIPTSQSRFADMLLSRGLDQLEAELCSGTGQA